VKRKDDDGETYLMNILKGSRHVGLVSSHDRELVDSLTRILPTMGYKAEVSARPAMFGKKKNNA
jgi:phage replication-related protein YjqB (UPF0714/DUF867 family)